MSRSRTSSFGSSKREGHDASEFYRRNLYGTLPMLNVDLESERAEDDRPAAPVRPDHDWFNQIYCHTSERMVHVPDASVALAFTSPPYNAGKEYDEDLDLASYLKLIGRVGAEVYRTLQPGGRYLINIANLGRKPYVPLHAYFYALHMNMGFLPQGEIIWRKSKGMNGNCAWGSWRSAKNPVLRDVHEYILVLTKDRFGRPDRGESTISSEDFMEATLSVWDIPPASARKVGHPAPFPLALAERVVQLYSYADDVILDPFNGSGTTCVAALKHGRRYVGYDISSEYCSLAERNVAMERERLDAERQVEIPLEAEHRGTANATKGES